MGMTYLMQNESAGYLGNSPLFWPKNNSGYTDKIDDAKVFTYAEANALVQSTKGSHRWRRWNVRDIGEGVTHYCEIIPPGEGEQL